MKLLVATGNRGKLLEFERILKPLGIEVLSPLDMGMDKDVEETGTTFAENAEIKAAEFYKLYKIPTVADDSGLCVDALDGRPGVYSARYMGNAPQSEKNMSLIKELENVTGDRRSARFICAICCVLEDGEKVTADGVCEGKIAYEPSGNNGFGYDPIFLVGEKSFAALGDAEKDEISHRGKALREFYEKLRRYMENRDGNKENNA